MFWMQYSASRPPAFESGWRDVKPRNEQSTKAKSTDAKPTGARLTGAKPPDAKPPDADRRETDRREAERCDAGQWVEVGASATDADGRCRDLTKDVEAGVYRLTFSTGAYLEGQGRTGIYPEISITFNCGGEANYHLPLLLSDNSYTTYRGS